MQNNNKTKHASDPSEACTEVSQQNILTFIFHVLVVIRNFGVFPDLDIARICEFYTHDMRESLVGFRRL
jgi:hypothetical protein